VNKIASMVAAAAFAGAALSMATAGNAQMMSGSSSGRGMMNCGYWQNGTWYPAVGANAGDCPNAHGFLSHRRAFVSGTITHVNGHLVTVAQSKGNIVINDQPALNRKMTGTVAVGRQIIALGHWRLGTFYATSIHNGPLSRADMMNGSY
jgi:hypothetical protein